MKKRFSVWCWLAICSIACSFYTFYQGVDKMTNYSNSDFYSARKNAYVGGDAYNYIINGTYSTSFFVLTAMFVLAAIGFIIIHYISKKQVDLVNNETESLPEL